MKNEKLKEFKQVKNYLTNNLWWIDGIKYSEEEFNQIIAKKTLNKKLENSLEPKQKEKKKKI